MEIRKSTLLILATLNLLISGGAGQAEQITSHAQSVAAFFRPFVRTLDRSVLVYNWAQLKYEDPSLSGLFASDSEIAINRVVQKSHSYWEKSQYGNSSYYGPGLYVALDPTSTRSYGGRGDGWLLSEIRLPATFRYINLLRNSSARVSQSVKDIFVSEGCPSEWNSSEAYLDKLLSQKHAADEKCVSFIKSVFQDDLQMDGFLYVYESSNFLECPAPVLKTFGTVSYDVAKGYFPERNAAMIITSDRWISKSSIRVYNAKSNDNRAARIRILSLFYKAAHDKIEILNRGHMNIAYGVRGYEQVVKQWVQTKWPGFKYARWDREPSDCSSQDCYRARICPDQLPESSYDSPECITLDSWPSYPVPTYPNVMHAQTLTTDVDEYMTFLWKDLDHEPLAPDLSSWVRENFFACSQAE